MRQYGLVALAIPGMLILTGISTLADASPLPNVDSLNILLGSVGFLA